MESNGKDTFCARTVLKSRANQKTFANATRRTVRTSSWLNCLMAAFVDCSLTDGTVWLCNNPKQIEHNLINNFIGRLRFSFSSSSPLALLWFQLRRQSKRPSPERKPVCDNVKTNFQCWQSEVVWCANPANQCSNCLCSLVFQSNRQLTVRWNSVKLFCNQGS